MNPPRISLVIPAYNEARLLPRLLDSVDAARAAYSRGSDAVEVIVADNASTDGTAAIARGRGCRVARVERRVIAASRNGGAAIAEGEILAFIDADSTIHPRTFDAIEAAMAEDRVVGGATGVTLDRWSLPIAFTFALLLPVVWITGFDTGVVFCRRSDFEALGGYDERLRLAEDVHFLHRLRRLGRGRGQRLTRLRPVKAVASTRKFDDFGDWRYALLVPAVVLWALIRRRPVVEALERYWYEPKR